MDSPRIAHRLPIDFPRIATECPRSAHGVSLDYMLINWPGNAHRLPTDFLRIAQGLQFIFKARNSFNDSAVLLKDDHKIYLN